MLLLTQPESDLYQSQPEIHLDLWRRSTLVDLLQPGGSRDERLSVFTVTVLVRKIHVPKSQSRTVLSESLSLANWNKLVNTCELGCVEASWNVTVNAQKPDFVFRRNWRIHLNRQGRQFSRLLAAKVCASAVVMLDTPCSEVLWEVLDTHSIRQFPSHFLSLASPCAITFQLESTTLPDRDMQISSWLQLSPPKHTPHPAA